MVYSFVKESRDGPDVPGLPRWGRDFVCSNLEIRHYKLWDKFNASMMAPHRYFGEFVLLDTDPMCEQSPVAIVWGESLPVSDYHMEDEGRESGVHEQGGRISGRRP